MRIIYIISMLFVLLVPLIKVVSGADQETRCKRLESDYNILLKLVQLEEKISKQETTIKILTAELKGKQHFCYIIFVSFIIVFFLSKFNIRPQIMTLFCC